MLPGLDSGSRCLGFSLEVHSRVVTHVSLSLSLSLHIHTHTSLSLSHTTHTHRFRYGVHYVLGLEPGSSRRQIHDDTSILVVWLN